MTYIFLIAFLLLVILVPVVRTIIFHPFSTLYYLVKDCFLYLYRKEYNNAPYGQIKTFIADNAVSFGCGKTLSLSRVIVDLYSKFDGKIVWSESRKRFVTQRIHVLSNIEFTTIPYEKLISLAQFVQETNEEYLDKDIENNTLTVTYLVIDEASSQLNSRDFKSNFNGLFISRLLTSRHVRASVFLTSQRAGMIDKLMREVTNLYIGCKKVWRFQFNNYYDAYEVENALTPSLVQPLRRNVWFIRDSDFLRYDTFASVQELKKKFEAGDMLSEEQIIALQGGPDLANMDVVRRPSRWWSKRSSSTSDRKGS